MRGFLSRGQVRLSDGRRVTLSTGTASYHFCTVKLIVSDRRFHSCNLDALAGELGVFEA